MALPSSTSSIQQRHRRELRELVRRIVPSSATATDTDEALVEFAEEMLKDWLQPNPTRTPKEDLGLVSEEARRYVGTSAGQNSSTPQRITNVTSKLSTYSHPRDKAAVMRFLLSLAPPLPASIRQTTRMGSGLDRVENDGPSKLHLHVEKACTNHAPNDKGKSRATETSPPANEASTNPLDATEPMSMALRLRLHRQQTHSIGISEKKLLRDVLYILQGIDGEYIRFRPTSEDEDEALRPGDITFHDGKSDGTIPTNQRNLIMKLAEIGHLYQQVSLACSPTEVEAEARGVVEQSLVYALKAELTKFYRLLAVIESQVLPSTESRQGRTDVTLKRLLLFLSPALLQLRLATALAHSTLLASPPVRGGALISLLHSYTSHGDPFVHTFTRGLLEEVSKPLFAILGRWIWEGELVDPGEEFFAQLNPEMSGLGWGRRDGSGTRGGVLGDGEEEEEGVSGWKLWSGKFGFRKEMLPAFISESFGRKIFSTGKSLNFIKYSCGDADWVVNASALPASGHELHYADISGLERTITLAYSTASQRLFDIFFGKFRLLDHLKALKDYMLLGKGDFVSLLMESLGPSLSRPANTLYRHNLTATLETALRGSSSINDDAEIVRRLDARMLEFSHGEVGWDVFTLEYKVEAPLDTVLSPTSMEGYARCFRWLWSVKRVEWCLGECWRSLSTGARSVLKIPSLQYDFHQTRIVLSEMLHFIRQLDSYSHLEVIECSWQELEKIISQRSSSIDLDGFIDAHDTYLDRLVSKCLLLTSKSGREEMLLKKVKEALSTILSFKDTADSLYSYALSESLRLQNFGQTIGFDPDSDELRDASSPANSRALEDIRHRLAKFATLYTQLITEIIVGLASQPDCKVCSPQCYMVLTWTCM